jgi:CheY-like chemotaxis protein
MIATPHIILIDDNRAWLDALAEYFRAHGLVVFTASDPRQGLDLLKDHQVNVVISDFNLPFMDGLQVLRSVRGRAGHVAVVLLTSEEEPSLEKKALAEGAGGFFAKTTEPALLLRKLLQAIAILAAAQQSPRVLEPWQRLLPSPQSANRRGGFGQTASRALELWQRLLPDLRSRGQTNEFTVSRTSNSAA